jgi:hypothetical protein
MKGGSEEDVTIFEKAFAIMPPAKQVTTKLPNPDVECFPAHTQPGHNSKALCCDQPLLKHRVVFARVRRSGRLAP